MMPFFRRHSFDLADEVRSLQPLSASRMLSSVCQRTWGSQSFVPPSLRHPDGTVEPAHRTPRREKGRAAHSRALRRQRAETTQSTDSRPALLRHLRYTQALIRQMAQTAVCNRQNAIEKRRCRWLRFRLVRFVSNELTMPHELIANMLRVCRGYVTGRPATCRQQD